MEWGHGMGSHLDRLSENTDNNFIDTIYCASYALQVQYMVGGILKFAFSDSLSISDFDNKR